MNYDGQQLCGVDDRLGASGQMCRWPSLDVTWSITGTLPNIEPETFKRVCDQAWSAWAKVCGIRPRYVEGPGNLSIGIQTIGPGGVLADCELPCGASMQSRLRMRIDTAEAWVVADNPPSSKVDLLRVLIHEIGHGIGIPHVGTGNLMAPIYSTTINRPMSGDISEAVSRYGLSAPIPPTDPEPGELAEVMALLSNGQRFFVRRNGVITPV